ncbi:MAG: metallophosphoesterase [Candidatus Bathyarchaeota archaeon]|nr:metallophosphoesterase [Candidatus Bathyarchaeota archaeon]
MNEKIEKRTDDFFSIEKGIKPYTNLNFQNNPVNFQFALISDNAGSGRSGVLPAAIEVANLLQPEFVANLGDLVEGYMDATGHMASEETYRSWWKEIDSYLSKLDMPFFFLPGNHDLNNPASVKVWRERHGGKREYYHFVYQNVLFLMISTEDPPKDTDNLRATDPEHAILIDNAYKAVKQAIAKGESEKKVLELLSPIEEFVGGINISDAQVDYFKKVLEANPNVRWTFCLMHSPAWRTASGFEQNIGNFAKIENLLANRPYTVFAAHTHLYNYTERFGRDYITTACSGAMNIPRLGAIDHIVWVTMTENGPKIANILLNGILDKKGPMKGDLMENRGLYKPRFNK